MAQTKTLALASGNREPKRGGLRWILALGLLSTLSAAIGGGFGIVMVSGIEKRIEQRIKAKSETKATAARYFGDIAIKSVPAVVTNLANSDSDWIRLESSIVYKNDAAKNPDVLVAETRQDVLAYLRTISLAQVQGPSGLLHVREDLNERVQMRSNGAIQELVVEALVVQ